MTYASVSTFLIQLFDRGSSARFFCARASHSVREKKSPIKNPSDGFVASSPFSIIAVVVVEVHASCTSFWLYHYRQNWRLWPPYDPLQVRDFMRTREGGRGGIASQLDYPSFVKAYAWVFYRGRGSGNSNDGSSGEHSDASSGISSGLERGRKVSRGSSRRHSRSESREQPAKKLGHNYFRGGAKSWDGGGSRGTSDGERGRRRRRRTSGGGSGGGVVVGAGAGIGEEAELRRWEKRLGRKQMRRLENVFDRWAERSDEGERGSFVEARDLEQCFKNLGREVGARELRAWCKEVDLGPEDALSLANFAYAFHAMFIDAGEGGLWLLAVYIHMFLVEGCTSTSVRVALHRCNHRWDE